MAASGQLSLSVELGTLSLQLVGIVIPNVVWQFWNPYRCNALTKHLFRNGLCKHYLCWLWSIKFCAPPISCQSRSNRFLSPELVLQVFLTTLWFKLKMLLLSMHCIAYAFGKHGYTNVHSHENSVLFLASLVSYVVIPWLKVPQRSLGHRVCYSHPTATRSALRYLGCEIATRHTDPLPTFDCPCNH
jgi:hypothetical protein